MKLLKRLLHLDMVYEKKTPAALLYDAALSAVLIYAAVLTTGESLVVWNTLVIAFIIMLLYFNLRELLPTLKAHHILRNREYVYRYYIEKERRPNALSRETASSTQAFVQDHNSSLLDSALNEKLNQVDHINMLGIRNGLLIYDGVFDFYRETKSGKYKGKSVYFTIFEMELARNVPHIFFDSIKARGREFKSEYVDSQRLSFEGTFDKHFDAYSPLHYHIDTLSFITPEVMQIMIELKEFDMELIDGRMICYGPLLSRKELRNVQKKVRRLQEALNDNLDTYSDSYRTEENSVTDFSRRLLKSYKKLIPAIIVPALVFLATLPFALGVDSFSKFSVNLVAINIVTGLAVIGNLYNVYKIKKENAQRLEAFKGKIKSVQ